MTASLQVGGGVNRNKRMIDRIWIFPRGLQLRPPRVDSQIFDRIMAALLESRELEIEYKKPSNQASAVRTSEPLGIVERSGVYCVIGYEKYSESKKNWAMHRIRSAKEEGLYC